MLWYGMIWYACLVFVVSHPTTCCPRLIRIPFQVGYVPCPSLSSPPDPGPTSLSGSGFVRYEETNIIKRNSQCKNIWRGYNSYFVVLLHLDMKRVLTPKGNKKDICSALCEWIPSSPPIKSKTFPSLSSATPVTFVPFIASRLSMLVWENPKGKKQYAKEQVI